MAQEMTGPRRIRFFVKLFAVTALSVLALGFLAAFIFWKTVFGGNAPLEQGRAITEGVWCVKDGFVSMALVKSATGYLLLDAGLSAEPKALRDALRARGASLADLRGVLLTHAHGDHVGALRALGNVPVYAMKAEVPFVEGRAGLPGPFGRRITNQPGLRVTFALEDGETFSADGRTVRAYHVPGHTPGSAVYLIDGVLFLGDTVNADKNGAVKSSPRFFSADADLNDRSLKTLVARLEKENQTVRTLVFAHSAALAGLAPLKAYLNR